jgi:hypothetical protein
MQIKIGVIGTAAVVKRLLSVIREFPTLRPVVREIGRVEEAPARAGELAKETEVLFVFGPVAHRLVKERVHASVPVVQAPLTGAGLYRVLFSALKSGRLGGGISVDTLTKTMVMRTLRDLGLEDVRVTVYNGPAYASPEKLVAFHAQQAAAGSSTLAVTGVASVAEELAARGVPVEHLIPSEQDMVVALERALLSTESRRNKEAQIVVGMLAVDDFGSLVLKKSSELEVQKLKLDIHRMVLDYVESLDGYLTPIGEGEYLFFTTRGIFERETGGYKTIHLAKDARASHGITLSLGVGFGASANEAGMNARAALRKSREAGGNACFIIREDQTLLGPLEMSDPVQTVLPPTDAELIRKAEKAGMTSAYLSKLLTHAAKSGKYDYKAHELADVLGITIRSAHRLLQAWSDNGLVKVVDMEKLSKGRPRQIYRFTFLMGRGNPQGSSGTE